MRESFKFISWIDIYVCEKHFNELKDKIEIGFYKEDNGRDCTVNDCFSKSKYLLSIIGRVEVGCIP